MSDPMLRHRALPASDHVRHPLRTPLTRLRWLARAVLRRRWTIRQHGREAVPRRGPVILAVNHTGYMDGPLLTIFAPRPVHALTKQEAFTGAMGPFLRFAGQIRLDRFHTDPGAIKRALRVLREGGVVGVFPEGTRGEGDFRTRFHHGAAYLALCTGAPVVPAVMFGVRAPGEKSSAVPPRGAVVDIVYGRRWQIPAERWPRRRARVRAVSADLQRHLAQVADEAVASTGLRLPGPLPAGDKEIAVAAEVERREHHD